MLGRPAELFLAIKLKDDPHTKYSASLLFAIEIIIEQKSIRKKTFNLRTYPQIFMMNWLNIKFRVAITTLPYVCDEVCLQK